MAGLLANERALPGDGEPAATELDDVLTEDLGGLAVADVVVQGVAAVGHLLRAVRPANTTQKPLSRARARDRIAGGQERWPCPCARSRATTRGLGVRCERVEHVATSVEEDRSVGRAMGLHRAYPWRGAGRCHRNE